MKKTCLYLGLALLFSCNQESKQAAQEAPATADSTGAYPGENPNLDAIEPPADSSLLLLSRTILAAFKAKDFEKIAGYIHPEWQLRFSPYAYVDTITDQALSPYELRMAVEKSSVLNWGSFDGSGDPMKMNIEDYTDKFIYSSDFLNAPRTSINQFLGSGNSLNNLREIYAADDFTEFYFPGFDPKYEGMDWQTLRLVFRKQGGKPYLVAIIHDQWTI